MSNSQRRLLEQGLCIICGLQNDGASRYRCSVCLEKDKMRATIKHGRIKNELQDKRRD